MQKFILPFNAQDVTLAQVGGKAINLAKLAQAGFRVPGGFFVTTAGYEVFVASNRLQERILERIGKIDVNNPSELQDVARDIRAWFAEGELPPELAAAIRAGYAQAAGAAVAVRSSATAEDLPRMSFAGQQDTFLNVVGEGNLLKSVVACWSSLWTARAIGYRARNGIAQDEVALAVVVQEMVQSEAAGVLFTANPLTGRRDEMVIDATLGLGEALVGGHVEPDHYVVETATRQISSRFLGAKELAIHAGEESGTLTEEIHAGHLQALPDEAILSLSDLGQKVVDLYDFPQDIEWAWADEKLYLLQSRPITALYPIPEEMKNPPLKAMFGFHAVQGIMEPITPLGQDMMKLMLSNSALAFGVDVDYKEQVGITSAGERLWINITSIIKHPMGHKVYATAIKSIDLGVAQALKDLDDEPGLQPEGPIINFRSLVRLLKFVIPAWARLIKIWRKPDKEAARILELFSSTVAQTQKDIESPPDTGVWERYSRQVALLYEARYIFPYMVIPQGVVAVVAGMAPFFGILQRFSAQAAQVLDDPALKLLPLEIARGLPHNVTTEMDLILWDTAKAIAADTASAQMFNTLNPAELSTKYQNEQLPKIAQEAVTAFMKQYGMRGLGEIDIGRLRWRENPTHVMQVVQSYLKIEDPEKAPDVVFAKGAKAAEKAAQRLINAVQKTKHGRLKAKAVRWAVTRYRAVAGLREAPKFFAIRMMGIIRQGLLKSGEDFVAAGLLEQADDLFFLKIDELEKIKTEKTIPDTFKTLVDERRAARAVEMRRKQIPRLLLNDGRAFYEGMRAPVGDEDALVGDPVSPGVVEGKVRVILDPHGAELFPGEILVCPGTDPAWTPLFLAAGGLVMEVGGMMTHGSVVAREYGIPAVVGVNQATTRLKTGQRVRVSGSSGQIEVLEG